MVIVIGDQPVVWHGYDETRGMLREIHQPVFDFRDDHHPFWVDTIEVFREGQVVWYDKQRRAPLWKLPRQLIQAAAVTLGAWLLGQLFEGVQP